jgi:signal transduction histidine kinase
MRAERERARLLAREQQARREAEAASRDKDALLAMAAHDLRVPLGAILGWIQLLRLEKSQSKDFVQALDSIERNAMLQARLIDDLLDVSRIANGNLQLDRRGIKLSSVVERAVDTVRPVANIKGIWLQAALDPDADDVFGDPNRLQQVVWNLLANAIKFTPDGGQILISARRAGSNVQLAVSDTGKGISPDFLPYVFDRFKQGDASAERTGGLGLGLAIARHIVELHGGTIRAYSEGPERGAVFTVELPLVAVHSHEEFSSNNEVVHSFV